MEGVREWDINRLKIWRYGKNPVGWRFVYIRCLRIAGITASRTRCVKLRYQSQVIPALLNSLRTFMYYTYVLQSKIDGNFYTGYTKDLKLRFEQHNKGLVESTIDRRPLELIYYEACLNSDDATHREKYLKSYHGKSYIRKRLKSYLTG